MAPAEGERCASVQPGPSDPAGAGDQSGDHTDNGPAPRLTTGATHCPECGWAGVHTHACTRKPGAVPVPVDYDATGAHWRDVRARLLGRRP